MRFIAALFTPDLLRRAAGSNLSRNCRGLKVRVAVSAVAGLFFSYSAALADEYICDRQGDRSCTCASPEAAEQLPPPPSGCHRERITAAGEQSLGLIRSAEHLGRKAWMREAVTKYGERFQQWENAACRSTECVAGALAGSRRCTYSAFACSPDIDVKVLADLKRDRGDAPPPPEYYERAREERGNRRELGREETVELQRLLRRAGYQVSLDGAFGEETSEALIKWQHRAGVTADGEATFKNLEMLRRAMR